MGKTGAILAVAAVGGFLYCATAQTTAPPPGVQVGRYQLVGALETDGRVLTVIDTTTGQSCRLGLDPAK